MTAGLIAATGALGLVMVLTRMQDLRRPTVATRVRPYLPSRGAARAGVGQGPWSATFVVVLRPVLRDALALVDRWFGGRRALAERLDQAGLATDVDAFRLRQCAAGLAGIASAVAWSTLRLVGGGGVDPVPTVALVALAGAAGPLVVDQLLSARIARRRAQMLAELPTIAELLALSVAAGESVASALERVARIGRGALADELTRTVAEIRSGTPLVESLTGLSRRSGQPSVARFVDGIVIAVERGTPLADVLRAQATDVRDVGRRDLMETAGRREIAMMVPVVFLVMPVTVVFALFPGFFGLSLTV